MASRFSSGFQDKGFVYKGEMKNFREYPEENWGPFLSSRQVMHPFVLGNHDWLNCRTIHYDKSKMEKCISNNGGKLRIYFIGDSRARQLFEASLLEMQDFPLRVYGDRVNMVKGKPELDVNTLELQNNSKVLIKYFTTLHHRTPQSKIIERYLREFSRTSHEKIPDLIVISFMQWEVFRSKAETLRGFDYGMTDMKDISREIKQNSQEFSQKGVKLVWLLVDDIKRFSYNHNQGYSMELFNQISLHYLRSAAINGGISLWDSGFPISMRVFKDCEIREKKGFFSYSRLKNRTDKDSGWKCSDMAHVGPKATRTHIQILFNFICKN